MKRIVSCSSALLLYLTFNAECYNRYLSTLLCELVWCFTLPSFQKNVYQEGINIGENILIFYASEKAITRNCGKLDSPTQGQWLVIVEEIFTIEKDFSKKVS